MTPGVQEEPAVLRAFGEGTHHDFARLVDSPACGERPRKRVQREDVGARLQLLSARAIAFGSSIRRVARYRAKVRGSVMLPRYVSSCSVASASALSPCTRSASASVH